jgi:hypothetical protein
MFLISVVLFAVAYNIAMSEVPYYLNESGGGLRLISVTARLIHEFLGKYGASLFFVGLGLFFLRWSLPKLFIIRSRKDKFLK